MALQKFKTDYTPTLKALYPKLSEHELEQAEENIRSYLDLALRIYKRIRSDPASYRRFLKLTARRPEDTIKPLESS